jgi:hypothetical protein
MRRASTVKPHCAALARRGLFPDVSSMKAAIIGVSGQAGAS